MSDMKLVSAAFDIIDQPVVAAKKEKIIYMNTQAILLAGKDMTGKPVSLLIPSHITNTQASAFAATAFIGKSNCTVKVRAYEGMKIYVMQSHAAFPKPGEMFQASVRSTLANIKFIADRVGVLAEDSADERLHEYVCMLNRNYYRMKHFIDNVGMVNALADGTQVFNPGPSNITGLCRRTIDTVREMYRDLPVSMTLNAEEELRLVADESLLEILLLNLLSNSIISCEKGGKINVSLLHVGSAVVLSVDDNGRGILPEELSTVFDRYRYGTGINRQYGSGMGLTVVRGIAELHKGTVIIESRGENMGTSVRVTLSSNIPAGKFFSRSKTGDDCAGVPLILTHLAECLPSECFADRID